MSKKIENFEVGLKSSALTEFIYFNICFTRRLSLQHIKNSEYSGFIYGISFSKICILIYKN